MSDTNKFMVIKNIIRIFLLGFVFILSFLLQGCTKNEKRINDYNPYFSGEPTYSQLNLEYTYVKFGEYPQSKIKKNELTDEIVNLDYDEDGIASLKNGNDNKSNSKQKILRIERDDIYEYYWIESILWRVLECDDEKAVLWSDCIIDSKRFYDGTDKSNVTSLDSISLDTTSIDATSLDNKLSETQLMWSESDLRDWLNGEFYEVAFSGEEKKSMVIQEYKNYSSEFGYPMGEKDRKKYTVNSTNDMVSIRDYYSLIGFQYDCQYKIKGKENEVVLPDIEQYLECRNTDYAMNRFIRNLAPDEIYYEKYVPGYWTRTPITDTEYLEYVDISASSASLSSFADEEGKRNYYKSSLGVRPVIVIKKSDVQRFITKEYKQGE